MDHIAGLQHMIRRFKPHNHIFFTVKHHTIAFLVSVCLDMNRDFRTFSVPAKRFHSRSRPFGGLATLVSASIESSLFSSSDTFLAVGVGYCVLISVYLPTNHKNDELERLCAQDCEILHALDKFKNLISIVLLLKTLILILILLDQQHHFVLLFFVVFFLMS